MIQHSTRQRIPYKTGKINTLAFSLTVKHTRLGWSLISKAEHLLRDDPEWEQVIEKNCNSWAYMKEKHMNKMWMLVVLVQNPDPAWNQYLEFKIIIKASTER